MAIAGRANFASTKEVELAQIKDGLPQSGYGKQRNCKTINVSIHNSVPNFVVDTSYSNFGTKFPQCSQSVGFPTKVDVH